MAPPPKGNAIATMNRKIITQEELITEITIKPLLLKQQDKQESLSNDFEWDNDFVDNPDTMENQ